MAQLCPNFEVTSYRDFSDLSSQDFLEFGKFFSSIDFWASWLLESFCFHKACLQKLRLDCKPGLGRRKEHQRGINTKKENIERDYSVHQLFLI